MPEFEHAAPHGPVTEPRPWAGLAGRWAALPRPVRAGAALAAAIAAVVAAGTAARLAREAPPETPPATRFELTAPRPPVLDLPGRVTEVELAADGGVVLALQCEGDVCRRSLGVRLGDRWRAATLPSALATGPQHEPVEPVLLPHGRILVRTPSAGWFSPDSGTSWRRAPDRPGQPVPHARGGRLIVVPIPRDQRGSCAGGRVGVISYRTGGTALLARQPRLDVCWVGAQPDQTGRHWVTGTDPETGRFAIASTVDGGATWQVEPLHGTAAGVTAAEVSWSAEVSSPGRNASRESAPRATRRYAVTLAGRYPGRTLVRALHARGTAGWYPVARWPDANLLTLRGEIVVRADGSLLAVDGAGMVVVSHDGGASFHATGDGPRLGPITRTGEGWVTQLQDVSYGWLVSRDGFTWRRLPVT